MLAAHTSMYAQDAPREQPPPSSNSVEQELRTSKRPLHPASADPIDPKVLDDRWGRAALLAGNMYQTRDAGSGQATERYRWIKPGLIMERVFIGTDGKSTIFHWEASTTKGGVITVRLAGMESPFQEGVVQENGDLYLYFPGFLMRNQPGQLISPRDNFVRLAGAVFRKVENSAASTESAAAVEREVALEAAAPFRTWGVLRSLVGNEYYSRTRHNGIVIAKFSWIEQGKRMRVSYRDITGRELPGFDSIIADTGSLLEMSGPSTDGDRFHARPRPDGTLLFELRGLLSTVQSRGIYPIQGGYKLVTASGDQVDAASIQAASPWLALTGADRSALMEQHRTWHQQRQVELARAEEERRERAAAAAARREQEAEEDGGGSELFGALMLGVLQGVAQGYAARSAQMVSNQALANSIQERERARRAESAAQRDAEQARIARQKEADARLRMDAQQQARLAAQARQAEADSRRAATEAQIAQDRAARARVEQQRLQSEAQRVAAAPIPSRSAEGERSGGDGRSSAPRMLNFQEAVVVCPDRPRGDVWCKGPQREQGIVTLGGELDGRGWASNMCGTDVANVRDLGVEKGFRVFGCGRGLHPDRLGQDYHMDRAAEHGLVLPLRRTYRCADDARICR